MRYYVNEAGGWLTISEGGELFGAVPEGYREVTEAEFLEASGRGVTMPPEPGPAPEPGED
ncbi:hypothetical protein [Streptomyces chilikensis]|uniref:Uncharacterized protein n=1 Tax=Streptomyces chilikensis TaxID=1194079 RepID=A0ABV3EJG6_9ACTN